MISQLARSICESPTLKLNETAARLRDKGEPVIHLGGGEPKPADESASSGGDGAAASTREQERRQILDIFRGSGNTQ